MFIFLLSLVMERTAMANQKSFSKLVNQTPFSFVLFQATKCAKCKQLLNIMDELAEKYKEKVGMVMLDIDNSPKIAEQYKIDKVPTLTLFGKGKLISIYKGEWNKNAIISFCDELFENKVEELNDSFDVFEFQEKQPVNLIIASPDLILHANEFATTVYGRISVAILRNQSLAKSLGIEKAQIVRPLDGFTQNIDSLDVDSLKNISFPIIEHVNDVDDIESGKMPYTLCALIDEQDPLHRIILSNYIQSIHSNYDNVSYRCVDFYKASELAKQLNIYIFDNPLFVLFETGSRPKLLTNSSPNEEDIKQWLDKEIKGIEINEETETSGIIRLFARNFMRIVLDPRKDIVLLVGQPTMPDFSKAAENFRKLIQIMQKFPTIKFYTFDPVSQLVPGLQIPKSESPLITVWPATEQPSGATFPANIPFGAIIDSLLKVLKTPIPPTTLQEIQHELDRMNDKEL